MNETVSDAVVAGECPVIQLVAPRASVMEAVQRTLPEGESVVLVVQRHSAVAKYVDVHGVERSVMPFGDHVSLQEALVVTARAGKAQVTEAKILESVRECVTQVRNADSVESGLIHAFHLLAKHTMSHYAMRRLRHALGEERTRRVAAEDRADSLQQRLAEVEVACEECGVPDEVMECIRGSQEANG